MRYGRTPHDHETAGQGPSPQVTQVPSEAFTRQRSGDRDPHRPHKSAGQSLCRRPNTENASRLWRINGARNLAPQNGAAAQALSRAPALKADCGGADVSRDRQEPPSPGRSRRVESRRPADVRPRSLRLNVTTRIHAATSERPTGSDGGPVPFRTRRPAQDRRMRTRSVAAIRSPVRAMPRPRRR